MTTPDSCRYFLTYTGVKLPFNLVTPLSHNEIENRNTYFKGYYDADNRLTGFDKLVYGEIELAHRYLYHANGRLQQVDITDLDGDSTSLTFDEAGNPA